MHESRILDFRNCLCKNIRHLTSWVYDGFLHRNIQIVGRNEEHLILHQPRVTAMKVIFSYGSLSQYRSYH